MFLDWNLRQKVRERRSYFKHDPKTLRTEECAVEKRISYDDLIYNSEMQSKEVGFFDEVKQAKEINKSSKLRIQEGKACKVEINENNRLAKALTIESPFVVSILLIQTKPNI